MQSFLLDNLRDAKHDHDELPFERAKLVSRTFAVRFHLGFRRNKMVNCRLCRNA
jgi:hypothetical protein